MNRLATIFCLSLLFFACDNKLDVIEERQDIPIVYGVLSLSDTAQYIRVEKAFVDPETSALEIAQIEDSIYYRDIQVSLTNTEGDLFPLERVRGIDEGYPRDEGVILNDPNYLYKITTADLQLVETQDYTIKIQRAGDLPVIEATTNIVGESKFIRPNPLSSTAKLDFGFDNPTQIRWRNGVNAAIYDVYLDINLEETLNGVTEDKVVTWRIGRNVSNSESGTTTEVSKEGIEFYSFLASALDENPNIKRKYTGTDIRVEAGNGELEEFLRVGEANLGITSTQDVPTYTNLSSGRGIFASKAKSFYFGLDISLSTKDSLENGSITRGLNFEF